MTSFYGGSGGLIFESKPQPGAMIFKGMIGLVDDGATVVTLPSNHTAGWTYLVVTAGTYAGEECEIGDFIVCTIDGDISSNLDWKVIQGNVFGPALPAITTGDAGKAVTIKQDETGYEYTGPYAPASVQTEVEDIRIGSDGEKYETAGDAVREQFKKSYNAGANTSQIKQINKNKSDIYKLFYDAGDFSTYGINLFDCSKTHYNGMINTDGTITKSGEFIIYEMVLPQGEYTSNMPTLGVTKMSYIDIEGAYHVIIPNYVNNFEEHFTIPENASIVFLSFWSGRDEDAPSVDFAIFSLGMIVKGPKLPSEYIPFYKNINANYKINDKNVSADSNFSDFVDPEIVTEAIKTSGFNIINVNDYKRGVVSNQGILVEQNDEPTTNFVFYVSVKPNTKYAINAVPISVHSYRSNGDFAGKMDPELSNSDNDWAVYSIPDGITKLAISMWYGRESDMNPLITQLKNIVLREGEKATQKRIGIPYVKALKDFKINRNNFDYIETNPRVSNGIYWSILGDSRSVDLTYTSKFYHDYICERHPVFNKTNFAVSGSRISTYNSSHSIIEQIDKVPNYADLITIYSAINDYAQDDPTPIGEFNPESEGTETFYDALNTALKKLIKSHPQSKILFFTPIPQYNFTIDSQVVQGDRNFKNSLSLTLDHYVNAIKEVCAWYGVKCFDACHESGITPRLPEQRDLYFKDGLHHNELGHLKLSYYFENSILNSI